MSCTFEAFKKDVANHKLHVLMDNGNYRHLLIKDPDNFEHHYSITTWPGYLCIHGDMGCFVFWRTEDMFTFFRKTPGSINPTYWQEKVQAGTGFKGAEAITSEPDFSAYDNRMDEYLADYIETLDAESEAGAQKIADAKEAVEDFKKCREDSEWDVVSRVNNWDPDAAGGMDLIDFWEGYRGLTKFTYHYLWCCYAIVHAVSLYDAAKIGEVAA